MDYEQKHKDALDRARNLHKDAIDMGAKDVIKLCEIIFPELAESEDERIKNALIRFHKSTIDIEGIKGKDIVAWLEKQGEQKPSDNSIDAFIEKACEWLKEQYEMVGVSFKEDFIERFKEDMKGE